MKSILLVVLNIFLKIINMVFNYRTIELLKKYKSKIFTMWIKNNLKKIGGDVFISSTVSFVGPQYISIGNGTGVLERARLECWDSYMGDKFYPKLTIGNNVSIGFNVHIGCINEIRIEDDVLLGANILITDHNHGHADENDVDVVPLKRPLISKGPVVIKKGVWIGDNATIMQNVCIGEFSIIGANSVVTKNVPAYAVVAGNPAKIIRILKK